MTSNRRIRSGAAALLVLVALLAGACSSAEPAATLPALTIDRAALVARQSGPPELQLLFPQDGSTVVSPVEIMVDVDNYSLAAKGVSNDGEGHFHVVDGTCIRPGEVIGDDHTHVGSGAASVEIELEPGTHELCLQLGDGFHTALAITRTLTLTVVETASMQATAN